MRRTVEGHRSGNRKNHFQLHGVSPPPEPEERVLPEALFEDEGEVRHATDSSHYLVLVGESAQQLLDHVGWGRRTATNGVEQGGILLGRIYRDPERKQVVGVVHAAIPGQGAQGSTTGLRMDTTVWAAMLGRLDQLRKDDQRDLHVVGWYHTHPNELGVFMSATDQETQSRFFNQDWHFSLVLNPHRRYFEVFHGRDSIRCAGWLDAERQLPVELQKGASRPGEITTRRPPEDHTPQYDARSEVGTEAPPSIGDSAQPGGAGPPWWRRWLGWPWLRRRRPRPIQAADVTLLEERPREGLVRVRLEVWIEKKALASRPDERS